MTAPRLEENVQISPAAVIDEMPDAFKAGVKYLGRGAGRFLKGCARRTGRTILAPFVIPTVLRKRDESYDPESLVERVAT
ncbi:MAG: hypothetical protein ACOCWQ_00755, partial [Nanoarchaeota archaeon]